LSSKIMLGLKIHQHIGYMKHDQYCSIIEALNKITVEFRVKNCRANCLRP
jgi:hypothetical protein